MTDYDIIEDGIQTYRQGYLRFRKITNSPYNENTVNRYRKYLGMPHNVLLGFWFTNADPRLRERVVNRAKQLLGPHGYTIYMAWRAQCQK